MFGIGERGYLKKTKTFAQQPVWDLAILQCKKRVINAECPTEKMQSAKKREQDKTKHYSVAQKAIYHTAPEIAKVQYNSLEIFT